MAISGAIIGGLFGGYIKPANTLNILFFCIQEGIIIPTLDYMSQNPYKFGSKNVVLRMNVKIHPRALF
jgi:hypothetical protein